MSKTMTIDNNAAAHKVTVKAPVTNSVEKQIEASQDRSISSGELIDHTPTQTPPTVETVTPDQAVPRLVMELTMEIKDGRKVLTEESEDTLSRLFFHTEKGHIDPYSARNGLNYQSGAFVMCCKVAALNVSYYSHATIGKYVEKIQAQQDELWEEEENIDDYIAKLADVVDDALDELTDKQRKVMFTKLAEMLSAKVA